VFGPPDLRLLSSNRFNAALKGWALNAEPGKARLKINFTGAEVSRRGSYGIDAPYLLPIPVILLLFNVVTALATHTVWPLLAALIIMACMASGLYTSLRGKFVIWAQLLGDLKLRGDECILDLGCGRGAVLLLAAEYLTTGRAVGVDIWRKSDQTRNDIEATRRNAETEGVADRVELFTADMTTLPFADQGFDVVVSNVAMHNIRGKTGRDKAIEEVLRVLRPGGRLRIADIFCTQDYMARLAALGATDVARRNLGWRSWWSGPWLSTYLITATKPALQPASRRGLI
jgi:ubiquinone/menaquinone biosynthesis C-methylase UbiE